MAKTIKKPVSVLLSILMALSMFGGLTFTALAAEPIAYMAYNAETGEFYEDVITDYTLVTTELPSGSWPDGWYVVTQDTPIANVSSYSIRNGTSSGGTVNLILCDGATLSFTGERTYLNTNLNIYGQSAGTGRLEMLRDNGAALYAYYQLSVYGGNVSIATNYASAYAVEMYRPTYVYGGSLTCQGPSNSIKTNYSITLADGYYVYSGSTAEDAVDIYPNSNGKYSLGAYVSINNQVPPPAQDKTALKARLDEVKELAALCGIICPDALEPVVSTDSWGNERVDFEGLNPIAARLQELYDSETASDGLIAAALSGISGLNRQLNYRINLSAPKTMAQDTQFHVYYNSPYEVVDFGENAVVVRSSATSTVSFTGLKEIRRSGAFSNSSGVSLSYDIIWNGSGTGINIPAPGLSFSDDLYSEWGFRIASGSGTAEDPFIPELIFDAPYNDDALRSLMGEAALYYNEIKDAYADHAAPIRSEILDAHGVIRANAAAQDDVDAAYDELYAAMQRAKDAIGALNAIALIDAIGTVELTDACKEKLDTAREAYDALSDNAKLNVTNYDVLTEAEAAYLALYANANRISYLAYNAETGAFEEKTLEYNEYAVVTPDTAFDADGWYVVKNDVEITRDSLYIRGRSNESLNLILCDGKTLTVNGTFSNYNLYMNIFGQAEGTGKLTVKPTNRNGSGAFNSSKAVTLHGGTLEGDSRNCNYAYGVYIDTTFTMYGGKLVAYGGLYAYGYYNYYQTNVIGGELVAFGDAEHGANYPGVYNNAKISLGDGMYLYTGPDEDHLTDAIPATGNTANKFDYIVRINKNVPPPAQDKSGLETTLDDIMGIYALSEIVYPGTYEKMQPVVEKAIAILASETASQGEVNNAITMLNALTVASGRQGSELDKSIAWDSPKAPVNEGIYKNGEVIGFSVNDPSYIYTGSQGVPRSVDLRIVWSGGSQTKAMYSFTEANGNAFGVTPDGEGTSFSFGGWGLKLIDGDGSQGAPYKFEYILEAPYNTDGLDSAMKEAALYWKSIKAAHEDIADTLAAAVTAAKADRYDPLATQDSLDTAEATLRAALAAAKDRVAFEEHKADAKNVAAAMAAEGDSAACAALIAAATDDIDALAYNENKTLDENTASVYAILDALVDDLAAQRNLDAFNAYKAEGKDAADAMAAEGDSAACAALIAAAKDDIAALTYDENKPLAENKAAVDAILDALAADLAAQRSLDAFNAYKAEGKDAADAMTEEGDSDACAALIAAARDDIAALTYDDAKSLAENEAAVDAILDALAAALAAQRAADQKAADEEAFAAYKADAIAAADALADADDSDECAALIADAKAALEALAYDDTKSLAENKAAADAILAQLNNDLSAQRVADATCPLCGEIHDASTFRGFFTELIHDMIFVVKRLTRFFCYEIFVD